MEEPVEHCGGQGGGAVVIEDRGPLLEGFIGGQHDGTAFVPGADDLKEQIGRPACRSADSPPHRAPAGWGRYTFLSSV